jgi:DNA-binding NarL/FixJ family response regulator
VCNANKVIARQLGLNEATVKAHVTAILKALKVEIRAQVPMSLENLEFDIKTMAR